MDLLTILCYVAIAWGVLKIFRISVDKWTIPTAILDEIVVVGALILTMNYNRPCTLRTQKAVVSISMVPQISSEVVEIVGKTNVSIEKGELLFHIDDTHYCVRLSKLKADLATGEAMLWARQVAIDDVSARVQQAQAEYGHITRDYQCYAQGAATSVNPFSEQDATHARQQVQIQTAVLQTARAQLQSTREQVSSCYNGLGANTASLKLQILKAEYNLTQTVVRMPNDGYIIQLLTQSGMTAVRLSFKSVLVFVPQQRRQVVVVFRRSSVLRLTAGDSAEAVFNGLPGSVCSGKASQVLPVIPDGSYQTSGALQGLSAGTGKEGIYMLVDLDPHPGVEHLPNGAGAQVVAYIDYFTHVSIMRKVLLRMTGWLRYLYLDY